MAAEGQFRVLASPCYSGSHHRGFVGPRAWLWRLQNARLDQNARNSCFQTHGWIKTRGFMRRSHSCLDVTCNARKRLAEM
jgi:hypothetical protein